jgi:hypothetical protein
VARLYELQVKEPTKLSEETGQAGGVDPPKTTKPPPRQRFWTLLASDQQWEM